MQDSDKTTTSISVLALFVSVAAACTSAYTSFGIDKAEEQNAVRQQITEALKEITSNEFKFVTVYRDKSINDQNYFQAVNSIIGQRRAILLQQVLYLDDKEPALMTSVDYNTIAYTEEKVGDTSSAEKYFKKAIDISPNDLLRGYATVSYADFLFNEQRKSEGRIQFAKAVSLIQGNNDIAHFKKGQIYQRWGLDEMTHPPIDQQRVAELFDSARKEFRDITTHAASCNALEQLYKFDGMVEKGCPSFNSLNNMGIEK